MVTKHNICRDTVNESTQREAGDEGQGIQRRAFIHRILRRSDVLLWPETLKQCVLTEEKIRFDTAGWPSTSNAQAAASSRPVATTPISNA